MKARLLALSVLAGCGATFSALAEPDALSLPQRLLAQSGAGAGLENYLRAGRAGFVAAMQKAPEEQSRRLIEGRDAALRIERLKSEAESRLAAALSSADMTEALDWLSGSAGIRIAGLESQGLSVSVPLPPNDGTSAWSTLQPERRALIRRAAAATGIAERSADAIVEMTFGFMRGYASATPGVLNFEVLRAKYRAERPAIVAERLQALATFAAISFQDLADEDVEDVARFMESPLGVRYRAALADATARALGDAGERFGRELARRVPGGR